MLGDFTSAQAEAVLELHNELDVTTERPVLEMAAREALAAVGLRK